MYCCDHLQPSSINRFSQNSELGCLTNLMKPTKKIAFKLLLNISHAINHHGAHKQQFLYRIVTGDEKWCLYVNMKQRKEWVASGDTLKPRIKQDFHPQKGYNLRFLGLRRCAVLGNARKECHGQIILLHDNARPHVAQVVKAALQELEWEVLQHPPYSPDLAPTDFHLFRSMSNHMRGITFDDEEDLKTWLNYFFDTRPGDFWRNGNNKLVECWEDVCADAFRMLTVAYGENTLDRSNVYRWYKMFSEGREDVNDEERAGHPSTSTTDKKVNEVEKMILANRRITVREVAEDLNISIGSCHSIFINDLGMRRVAAKFIPKFLNCDQKQQCMNIANEMLDFVRDDPNLLQRVITGDEAWVYGYDVETKAQSSQWKLPHEPRPKKARQVRSNVKVLLTVFFDCRGVVHHEFFPQGRTVNKEYYLQVMRNLRKAICQKRPDLWKNKNWLLHHDNAPAHTSLLVRDFLAKNNTLMMPQPPYSPDLAPCDFFLFPKLKRPMKGRRYATLDEIKTASKEELKKIFKNDFLKCFEDWKNRWHKKIQIVENFWSPWKMVISEPKSAHLREVLLFAFNWKKSATEAHRMLEEVHGDHALSKSQCYRWFKNSKVAISNLIMNHVENRTKSSRTLNCKLCWMTTVPHELSERQQERRLVTCEGLLARHEKKSFLHRIVTSDEKSIHFSNPMRQKSWGLLGQFPKRKPRPNRLGKKAMLCVWWDQTGVVYFKLLKPGEMVNTSRYEQQMHSLREALYEKRPELREKYKLILQHDNVPAHNATVVKNTIKDLGWDFLPHPPYSPDLAPSDYHLFTSLGHALKKQEFSNSDILRK
ncbi:hypothetical protein LAZ67_14001499 [Cordylochernes scorpioides]|uniref:Mos1 transposase HTH domain-containing protein n=1 Tax=Cordylochernes scorpioides TaxID=51811 RepID=A0ABY6LA49_9ARAC|nr:hypothetical protein LAZ67_14001499 [Cordylochernes scorpioides]